jgi:26S proteasome regulatory subunit N6
MSDPIIRSHFTSLYDNLLEQNLLRIVEPFSRVEVDHVAKLVGLPVLEIEAKYSLSVVVLTIG